MKNQITFSTYWLDMDNRAKQAIREKAFKARTCKPATSTNTKSGFGKINVNRKG